MKNKRSKERWFWYHWINDNIKPTKELGTPLKNGRAWFHFGKSAFNIEWSLGRFCFGFFVDTMGYSEEAGPGFRLGIFWLSLYGRLTHPVFHKIFSNANVTGFMLDRNAFEIRYLDDFWSEKPYHSWYFVYWDRFKDALLGRPKLSERTIESFTVAIPLPEKTYEGVAKVQESRWKRPRWPFAHKRLGSWVEMNASLPFPGKGENSWDCGEDGISAFGSSGIRYEDIVADGVRACMRNRVRYGHKNWRPAEPIKMSAASELINRGQGIEKLKDYSGWGCP